ncbi:MAG: MBL fold metallo-hydrolase, partial [Povalibacter sp.]
MPAKRPSFGAAIRDYAGSAQLSAGRFRNAAAKPTTKPDGKVMWDFFFNKPRNTVPATPVPIRPLTRAELEAAPTHSLYRLGHSTLLMKLRSGWWLTDPVFSKRASPFSFLGPKRFHAPPIALSQLPAIRGVILSHDHYDHLDKATIKVLAQRAGIFVSPLGVGDRLVSWGVPQDRVRQLDWWQSVMIDGVRLTATPSQHFSG